MTSRAAHLYFAQPGEPATMAHTLLADLVATSRDVREASRRLDKVGRLAASTRTGQRSGHSRAACAM